MRGRGKWAMAHLRPLLFRYIQKVHNPSLFLFDHSSMGWVSCLKCFKSSLSLIRCLIKSPCLRVVSSRDIG
jgi:hypothetical protein